ncbi:MAG: hypothetical protein ACTTGX_02070 [Candidatus Cryptobacteroides sp.]
MKHLFRIVLSVAVVAAMTLACKKTQPEQPKPQPEPKKDTTFVLEAAVSGEAKYDGSGDLSYTVKSIRKIDNKEEFMPWTMEFSTDGGNTWKAEKPDYLTLTVKEDNGGIEAKSYNATFAAQEKTLQTSDIILKAKPVLSNVDLSKVDIKGNALASQSTANCYVIHNPGTYKFPTVYGNAIKNGATNEKAYKSSKTGNPNILEKFIKADGNPITQPQIENINNACLIWQDTENLISNISFDSANQYVKFEVNKATIHNGNAIIAVRDNSNTILWSWHIWVTERDLHPVEVTNFQSNTYNFMSVNLGWCGFGNEFYAAREVKARLKQEGGKSVELAFNQKQERPNTDYDIKNGNNPYYQWGRKDPMLPSNGINTTDKECFTNDTQYAFNHTDLETDEIKEYIRNPHKFNTKDKMDGMYYNLWNADNDDTVIKTVYDPSPVGYSLPASNALTGFTTTGGNTINSSAFNVEGGFDKGWYFYRKPNKKGGTIFFPASGRRHVARGSLELVTTYGRYWIANPGDLFSGLYLSFYSGHIYPQEYIYRSYGHSVRPVQEQ